VSTNIQKLQKEAQSNLLFFFFFFFRQLYTIIVFNNQQVFDGNDFVYEINAMKGQTHDSTNCGVCDIVYNIRARNGITSTRVEFAFQIIWRSRGDEGVIVTAS